MRSADECDENDATTLTSVIANLLFLMNDCIEWCFLKFVLGSTSMPVSFFFIKIFYYITILLYYIVNYILRNSY